MGGEDQIKTLIRQAFSLQNAADRAVLDVDALLAQTMQNVRSLVEQLPEGSLLRMQTWKSLEPLVKQQMEPYARGLYLAMQRENGVAAPDMAAYAEREAIQAGAKIQQGLERLRLALLLIALMRQGWQEQGLRTCSQPSWRFTVDQIHVQGGRSEGSWRNNPRLDDAADC